MSDDDTRKAYADKIQANLDRWDAEIARLKARAEEAEADARLKYLDEVERLREREREAREQLRSLRDASDSAWHDLKAGMEEARDSIEAALKRARSRFE